MNIITIELCAEDRARLDRLSAALENANPLGRAAAALANLSNAAKAAADAAPAEEPAPDPVAVEVAEPEKYTPEEPEPPVAPPAPAEEPKKAPTVEELQAIVQELAAPGSAKRAAVRELVTSYASRVSLIPEDKRAEAMERLLALKEAKA